MAVTAVGAMLIGAALSTGVSIRGQQQAKDEARRAREAQEKELAEQRILDAAAKEAALREKADVAETEVGEDLTIGTRTSSKRTVRAAPNTGVRLA